MTLLEFLDDLKRTGSPGAVKRFAEACQVKQPTYLRQLALVVGGRRPSPELCVRIEQQSGGRVTRAELRPEDYRSIWPDLPERRTKRDRRSGAERRSIPTEAR